MRFLLILVVFLSLMNTTGCQSDPDQRVVDLMADYATLDSPGAAVSVIVDGEKIFHRGFGAAVLENSTPVTSATNFRLASITKQFTAMSVMMLVERGQLSYDTTLDTIFPELPEYAGKITVRHLLQHNSGLIDYESLIPDSASIQVHDADVYDMMVNLTDSTYFEPGSAYSYSNTGYAVLAVMIEEISGLSFPEFLKVNIFEPLGMSNTVAFVDGVNVVQNRATGYTVHADSIEFTDQSLTSAVLGDGGIYSSIDDLYLWDQALYTDQLVSFESLDRAFTPGLEIYGFGWRIDEFEGRRRYRHSGSTSGFRNFITRFPEDSTTVIILTNRAAPDVRDLGEKIARLYLD